MKSMRGKAASCQQGISLIEVLAAMLILAIGLLGLLAMQTRGVQLNQAAYFQSQAMFMAHDIIERMRANDGALDSYAIELEDFGDADAGYCDDADSACSAAEMAASDLYQWKTTIGDLFPQGDASVTLGTPSGNLQPVTVQVQYLYGELASYQLESML